MSKQQGDYDYLIPSETTQENPNWRSGIIPVQGYYRSRTLIRNRSDGPDIPKPSYAHGMFLQSQSMQRVGPLNTSSDGLGTYIKGVWNDLWGWVTGGGGNATPQGGGSIIRDSKDATQRMVDEMRRRQTQ
jgi:hypothetical protein